jgi:hypothetical protein
LETIMTVVTKTDSDQSPALPRGRLLFALDATFSRAPTWDLACDLQTRMFRETAPIGRLDVQLAFYRGTECRHSKWVSSGDQLAHLMHKIECVGGATQIGRILQHALNETERASLQAVIFVGDAMEENIDELAEMASKLGKAGVPLHMFQEGHDRKAEKAFRLLALKSGGAYFSFGTRTAQAIERLSNQLNAVARLAVGDGEALRQIGVQR